MDISTWLLRGIAMVAILGFPESMGMAQTNTFCALRISVQEQDGSPVHAALVDLIDPSQKVVQSQKVIDGRAEFCDFGFGYYSIRVRSDEPLDDSCETIVRNIKAIYGRSQRMNVILNTCLYGGEILGNGCTAYLRVTSSDGRPLNGVQIHQDNLPTIIADEYGRARIGARFISKSEYIVEKEGFVPQKVHFHCDHIPEEKEIAVELQRLR